MTTCKIRWIDGHGSPTPDDNPAIGRVRMVARDQRIGGQVVHFEASEWYPICAEHRSRMLGPPAWDDCHWEFEPLPTPGVQP